MPRQADSRGKTGNYRLTMEIEDHLTHYSLGERIPRGKPGPLITEITMITLWGTIVSPDEKAGRDMQITVRESQALAQPMPHAPPEAEPPVIGELGWGADRVARVHVPPTAIWPLIQAVGSGQITRIGITVDKPPRGTMPVRGMHALTRDVTIKIGKRLFGATDQANKD